MGARERHNVEVHRKDAIKTADGLMVYKNAEWLNPDSTTGRIKFSPFSL